jgi:hypothetical protein
MWQKILPTGQNHPPIHTNRRTTDIFLGFPQLRRSPSYGFRFTTDTRRLAMNFNQSATGLCRPATDTHRPATDMDRGATDQTRRATETNHPATDTRRRPTCLGRFARDILRFAKDFRPAMIHMNHWMAWSIAGAAIIGVISRDNSSSIFGSSLWFT